MARAFIAVGSNINPAENVRKALGLLARQAKLAGISTVYRTAPLGRPEQPHYYNCVVEIETGIASADLKQKLLRPIEEALGRIRTADKCASRTIDLDLIVYGDLTIDTDSIKLPDPQILERPFLALPLSELAPDLVLAGFNLPLREVTATIPRHGMEPLLDYTELLRHDLRRGFKH
jgi:2-amino-4-hydroxy-6-hydroxymethyldihydropteridine diphosphokinase